MKDIKEKLTGRVLKSNVTGKIPKAALKKAWTEAKEKSRTKLKESTAAQGESDYTTAQDTGAVLTDNPIRLSRKTPISPYSRGARLPASRFKNIGSAVPQSKPKPPASTPPMSSVSARNKPSTARCPMRRNARAVGQICPASGQKKKSSPPKPRRAIFAV